jgi:hypothetical protein
MCMCMCMGATGRAAARRQMAQLQVWRADVEPPFRQTDTVELQEGESYQLGRMASSALLLSDSRVSGRHAVFTAEADGMSVCDHSTNGTYLNGQRLEKGAPIVLADGDVVVPLVPLQLPPTEGCKPRADLVVAIVYRVAVAAPPCGLPPVATGEVSAQGSADSPDQPPDLAVSSPASECPVRSSPPDPVEPPAAPPARPPAEPPSKPPAVPAKPSAAFDFDMDEPAPPPARRRSDGGSSSGGGGGVGLTGGRLSKAKRRRSGDASTDGDDADQSLLSGGRRTSTTLKGDVLGFLRDDGTG